VALFATPEQSAVFRRIQGLMSLLEGHGDLVMDRAGADLIPSAGRFKEVLHQRRQAGGPAKMLQKLVGLEAKLRQYHEGETFLAAIEEAEPGSVSWLWRGPEWLPTIEEVRAPEQWLARARPLDNRAEAAAT
jgi:putative hydrolase